MEGEQTLLSNQQITEEIKICIEMNENENTTTQNLRDTVKTVLRGKFIAIHAYLKKQEKSLLQSRSHQESMLLAQRKKYRSMEQNRKSRDKSTHLWTPCLLQRRQKYTME